MSYNIDLQIPGELFAEAVFSCDVTYNYGVMFQVADPPFSLHDMHGWSAPQVEAACARLREQLVANPAKFDAVADQEWGTLAHLIGLLDGLIDACRKYPEAVLADVDRRGDAIVVEVSPEVTALTKKLQSAAYAVQKKNSYLRLWELEDTRTCLLLANAMINESNCTGTNEEWHYALS